MDDTEKPALAGTLGDFAAVKRAIVVCAHADDMETMMGGTVWLLSQSGVEVFELICTRGDLGTTDPQVGRDRLAEIRREEAERGAALLGVRGIAVLDYPDGELEPSLELRAQIAAYYREWQPDTLFTFDPNWPGQIHPDHRASGRAAIDALMPSKMPLFRPEQLARAPVANIQRAFLFSPGGGSLFVDVTPVYSRKIQASLAHLSQFPEGDRNLDWMRDLDRAAAGRSGLSVEYAEEFNSLRIW